ncbi:MAG: Single-stranded DNA-binding protein [Candidatus Moanabacter tarae]|uniref:Single-stranded DNA-binding protein n=1 Tax=Candidatus Moanibacter tarae TaxID=2200854 RepID=A0A2Z4AKE0_9BACT|nr:MAG: Single-stranded DNA-binding protein [Candidatus Moanabacter tarae]|tara:strand:+ start:35225 stop:35692 length:468 start_codon:yes stop_codon:yes gene_type:complete
MASFNKVILMGNLTRDPELRVTPSGTAICKMGLATSRTYTTQDGNQREETTFVDVDAFGKQAEVISKYMAKGRPILVEGRLRFDQWETNTGEKRSKLGVVLETFRFVGPRNTQETGTSSSPTPYTEDNSPPPREEPQSGKPDKEENFDDEDDVPF